MRAELLDDEDADDDRHRQRQDVGLEQRRRDVQPFNRAEHGDRRRDHAVAVQQRRAEDAQQHERGLAAPGPFGQKRRQREDAPLALVVGPHHDHDVLDGDDDDQRVQDQREDAQDVFVGGRYGMRAEEALPNRVQRTGADVSVDDSDGGQRERQERAVCTVRG